MLLETLVWGFGDLFRSRPPFQYVFSSLLDVPNTATHTIVEFYPRRLKLQLGTCREGMVETGERDAGRNAPCFGKHHGPDVHAEVLIESYEHLWANAFACAEPDPERDKPRLTKCF